MKDDFTEQLKILMTMLEPLPPIRYEYRLYYDKSTGNPLFFSMETPPGDYIIVTKEDYESAAINYIQVIDNKLVRKPLHSDIQNRFVPTADQGTRTIENDIQFVVDETYVGPVSIWRLND